ncbi:MAG: hypothetical protein F6K25_04575 [Okeania sp. SIO2G4]|uniref:hypothetical protein n=1 Tax=unclassified Okeania TaxID=2634635 RepID=UPI0013B61F7C|nr:MULTISPECIES: hypothetical protein [unclassified Okeania]NEP71532.1 hypothetical protein [Okeania sp. SIO2G5]NEP96030.1 hypothetical protein [Okeania sp. SIO2F5]NEQ90042.1 hypothetical protein [Okeania sp. SIO2G4]
MAKNSKKLDKSKNYNKINHTNENQLVELQLDELKLVVGGKRRGRRVPGDHGGG